MAEAESLCVCCSCAALCVGALMACLLYSCTLQHPCALSGEQCGGALQSLTEEEWKLLRGRCAISERATYDAAVVCKRHADEWRHWYKPPRCAACPRPLSASAWRPCPEWMREQLGAQHGAAVHKRPCYEKALAAKKQRAADPQPMEVEQENKPPQPTFHIDVSQHIDNSNASHTWAAHSHMRSLCADRQRWRKQLAPTSGAKRCSRAD